MKKIVKITTIISTIIFVFTLAGFGQDEMRINRNKNLEFNGESKTAVIKITSSDEYNYLRLNIACQLSEGKVTVEFVDPKGEKQGSFTVKTDEPPVTGENTKSEQMVSGQMSKAFSKPAKGDWFVRAIPTNAVGTLSLNISQGFEPRIDMINIREIK